MKKKTKYQARAEMWAVAGREGKTASRGTQRRILLAGYLRRVLSHPKTDRDDALLLSVLYEEEMVGIEAEAPMTAKLFRERFIFCLEKLFGRASGAKGGKAEGDQV